MDMENRPADLAPEQIEQLVSTVHSGDTEAYRRLVLHYQRRLHVYCSHMLGSPHEAEDAVQEILIACYRSIGRYRPAVSFTAWLYKAAYRHCLNLIGKRRRRRLAMDLFVRSVRQERPPDRSELIERLMMKLSPAEKHLLILRAVEGRPFAEIADMLDKKPAALRKTYERLRHKVKSAERKEQHHEGNKRQPDKGRRHAVAEGVVAADKPAGEGFL